MEEEASSEPLIEGSVVEIVDHFRISVPLLRVFHPVGSDRSNPGNAFIHDSPVDLQRNDKLLEGIFN